MAAALVAYAFGVVAVLAAVLSWPLLRRPILNQVHRLAALLKQEQRGAQRWCQRHSHSWLQSIAGQVGPVLREPLQQAAAARKSREEAAPAAAAVRVRLPLVVSPNFNEQVVYGGYCGRTRLAGIGIKVGGCCQRPSLLPYEFSVNSRAAKVYQYLVAATTPNLFIMQHCRDPLLHCRCGVMRPSRAMSTLRRWQQQSPQHSIQQQNKQCPQPSAKQTLQALSTCSASSAGKQRAMAATAAATMPAVAPVAAAMHGSC